MSINLLELINENISGDVISTLSGFLGESPKNTTSALSNAIPSLLAGMVSKSADSQGASGLFNLLSQGNHDGGILSNLAGAFGGGDNTNNLLSTGATLLSSVFGNKVDGVVNLIANASGISKTSSGSLLGLLMPMIMGVVGKTVKSQGITSATGLASLLATQGGFLKNFLPAGLSSIIGTAGLGEAGKTAYAATSTPNTYEEESDGFGKWLPWLLIPAILGLGWGLLKYFQAPPEATTETTVQQTTVAPPQITVPEIAAPKVETPVATPAATTAVTPAPVPEANVATAPVTTPAPEKAETAAPIVDKVTDFFEKTLSSGFALKASKDGIENKLIGFLEDTNRPVDKKTWFTMNGIEFDTGKATLRPESNVQLTNIVEIMKAFPKVKIKIGGYTDNVGKEKSNLALSAARAKTVKNALVAAGIDAKRFAAEGYGSKHPVAGNDTDEGRQQNRRIDVNVTAK